ncbi:MAG: nuclear transport factor 2 family protein [Balneolales bacterium]|nr:nuclear transport factor 2 family protein [Balneolales bacterium]
MRLLFTLILFFSVLPLHVAAQEAEKQAVQKVIENLFDGMREGDSAKVAMSFNRGAVMETIQMNPEGNVVKSTGSLKGFLNAVGTPHDQVWDEKIGSYEIKIDAGLATAWTPYQFYLGEQFSHCGVNSFQLAKLDGEWKIIYIVDTRRRSDCVE